jgi:5-oxopent-3-ene-1,2,5-tricarboxylate decarboxylase / 2-hydroxyhepta-2,4-diene-1,7-dioate isomerase
MNLSELRLDVPPYRLSGVVYAALLNDPRDVAALGEAAFAPPYKSPPQAPVLSLRPRNTLRLAGSAAVEMRVGAQLGLVIGRSACRVHVDSALDWVAGYLLAVDLQLPHASHYRPALRYMAHDGFCTLGRTLVPVAELPTPDEAAIQVLVDGAPTQRAAAAKPVRGAAQLLADVTEFMSLQAGDVLLLGSRFEGPLVRAGQLITADCAALGSIQVQIAAARAGT